MTTSTGGSVRPPSSNWPPNAATWGLPTTDPDELARSFAIAAPRRDLVRFLEFFTHTVGVMQHKDAIRRVAVECVEDLAADGVVDAEVRFAPELHTEEGLELPEVVESVLEGFRAGMAAASAVGRPIVVRALLTAMRTAARSLEIAELAVRYRDEGVAGFDAPGPEAGYPPTQHLDAFQLVQRENFHATLHAGEAFGLPSIWQALQWCNAERLGHGVRIVDDITVAPDGHVTLGRLASYIRDLRIPLELCPTSNVHTGVVADLADHPIGLLRRLRFRVTVNTDNRLMSGLTLSSELGEMRRRLRLGLAQPQLAGDQRDEERLLPLRRPARHHRHDDQAGLRGAPRRNPGGPGEPAFTAGGLAREHRLDVTAQPGEGRRGLGAGRFEPGPAGRFGPHLEVGLELRLGPARTEDDPGAIAQPPGENVGGREVPGPRRIVDDLGHVYPGEPVGVVRPQACLPSPPRNSPIAPSSSPRRATGLEAHAEAGGDVVQPVGEGATRRLLRGGELGGDERRREPVLVGDRVRYRVADGLLVAEDETGSGT